jgi:UDP-2,4-diacetamido-2,4,6-trideoxy-beta-L-altropyranose hydrolase
MRVIFRADASIEMGTGHVMRCLALAQACRDAGGAAVFVMAQSTYDIRQRLTVEGIDVIDLSCVGGSFQDSLEVCDIARLHGAKWVVVDGYQFDSEYQRTVKASGVKLLFVDDTSQCAHYYADLVLNQNAHASEEAYKNREAHTRVLAGGRYAILRREFAAWRDWKRDIPIVAKKILVTMGGSDPENATLRVIRSLRLLNLEGLGVKIVVGGSNPHLDCLRQELDQVSGDIQLVHVTANMPELMAWADVAVSAAGSTCWEMCFLGLPAILLDLATNQYPVGQALDRLGAAIHAESSNEVDREELAQTIQALLQSKDRRESLSAAARKLVDGNGVERVLATMQTGCIYLRRVEEKDCGILWEWANDPDVRAVSLNSDPISWQSHVEWFRSKMQNPDSVLYLALNSEDVPIGQVRCQINDGSAVLSISLAKEFRSKGYGGAVLQIAAAQFFQTSKVTSIDAYVKPDNAASLKLFDRAGFIRERTHLIEGQSAIRFVLEKEQKLGTLVSWPRGSEERGSVRKKIAISQPTYLPWLGYFDLIDQVDAFVLLDDVQFTKQSWQHRNRIKTATGLQWLTVPVKYHGRFGQLISDVEIRDPDFWRTQCRTIEVNYQSAPFFDVYFEELRSLFLSFGKATLVELNRRCLEWFMQVLGIHTPVFVSSRLRQPGKRTELLANLCSALDAKQYISPVGSAVYLLDEEDALVRKDIELLFQHYEHPQYRQLFPPFLPYASVLDLLFNEGGRAQEILRSGRRKAFTRDDIRGQVQLEVR